MNTRRQQADIPWYIYLPICISLGTGLGALLGNVGVGIVVGAALGTILNLLAYCNLKDRE
jgi:hypothetical protein